MEEGSRKNHHRGSRGKQSQRRIRRQISWLKLSLCVNKDGRASVEAAGLVDGMEDGDDDGGGEDDPNDGDALEEPINGVQHEISKQILSLGLSAARGDS
jgi:hypothetical protein